MLKEYLMFPKMNTEIAEYLWIGSQTSVMPKFFTLLERAPVKMYLSFYVLGFYTAAQEGK